MKRNAAYECFWGYLGLPPLLLPRCGEHPNFCLSKQYYGRNPNVGIYLIKEGFCLLADLVLPLSKD